MSAAPGTGQSIGLKQYTKDIPPGWKPYSYPLREYQEYLAVWSKLTRLDAAQIGPAIASRLEGGALTAALKLRTARLDEHGNATDLQGADVLSLVPQEAVLDQTGAEVVPGKNQAPAFSSTDCRHCSR